MTPQYREELLSQHRLHASISVDRDHVAPSEGVATSDGLPSLWVHFMRNVLAKVPRASVEMVAAAIRTIFAQPDAAHVRAQLDEITTMLAGQFPDVATMLAAAAEDLLAFSPFPQAHWRKLWSTNPLERLNGEIKRRSNVVIFPNDAAIARLVTAVVVETHDEWAVAQRRYLSEESMAQIHHCGLPVLAVEAPKARRRSA